MSTCMYIHCIHVHTLYTCTCTCCTLHCILFTFFVVALRLFWLVSVWEHLRWRTLTPSLKRICLASVSSLSWISWILLLRRVSLVAMCSLWSISSYQSLPGKTDQKCTCMTLHWSGKFLLLHLCKYCKATNFCTGFIYANYASQAPVTKNFITICYNALNSGTHK